MNRKTIKISIIILSIVISISLTLNNRDFQQVVQKILFPTIQTTKNFDLQGRHYQAKIDKECLPTNPEGCRNPGYFSFHSENGKPKVQFSLPGSDIIQSNSYTQIRQKVKINSIHDEVIYITISPDGQELREDKTNTVYYLEEDTDNLPPENTYDPNDPLSRPYPLDSDISQQNLDTCQMDIDCVPFPSCHSEICINKNYLSHYPNKSTYSCTEIFTPCEATSAECICENNKCVNSRLETIVCRDWKDRLNE